MDNYEVVKLYVPKELIKNEDEHPEKYGDLIVVLENDMYTDVYIDENGNYYSYTNNQNLINYIKSFNKEGENL